MKNVLMIGAAISWCSACWYCYNEDAVKAFLSIILCYQLTNTSQLNRIEDKIDEKVKE